SDRRRRCCEVSDRPEWKWFLPGLHRRQLQHRRDLDNRLLQTAIGALRSREPTEYDHVDHEYDHVNDEHDHVDDQYDHVDDEYDPGADHDHVVDEYDLGADHDHVVDEYDPGADHDHVVDDHDHLSADHDRAEDREAESQQQVPAPSRVRRCGVD